MSLTIPRRFTAALLSAHSAIGTIFGALVFLVCFSGSLAVLVDEFTVWERPSAPVVTTAGPVLIKRVATEGYRRALPMGKEGFLYVTAPSPVLPQLTIMAYHDGHEREWVADVRGQVTDRPPTPWTEFVREQHETFNLPPPFGSYFIGIIGTLLLASLGSGLFAHRRIIRDAFRLRWGGSRRLSNADLHNRVGVWALPFHLIVALTGSLLGLAGLIIGVLALVAFKGDQEKAIWALTGPQPTEDSRPAPLPDILPMIRQIAARTPNSTVTSVVFQHVGTAGQLVQVTTAEPAHLSRNEGWTFAPDGRLLAKAGFTDGSIGMRIYGMLQPLHFGTYGGLPLKLIYVVLGAGLTLTVATGMNVWFSRRRDQGRAAPGLERLWTALVWSQPAAFAVAAIAELLQVAAALPAYWIVILSAMAAGLRLGSAALVTRWLRLGSGALVAILVLVHLSTRPMALAPLVLDAALLILTGVLIRAGWARVQVAGDSAVPPLKLASERAPVLSTESAG